MVDTSTTASTAVLFADYCEEMLLKDLSSASIDQYKRQLVVFLRYLGDREPSARLAELFLAELRSKGYKRTTIRSYYYSLRLFLAYVGIPFKLKLRKEKRLPAYHCRDDLTRLLRRVKTSAHKAQPVKDRDYLIIKTLAYTGLRRSELLSLRCRDIRDSLLFVHAGKGEKDRVIPLMRQLNTDILSYILKRQLAPSDYLFPISSRRLSSLVKNYALSAGIDDLSTHSLRHYFATRLIEKGASLRVTQELLGHEDISTTAIYLDIVPMHLRKTIDLLEDE